MSSAVLSHCKEPTFDPRRNELTWKGARYSCVVGGHDLETDLSIDHGPITSVEPRISRMGFTYVQIFFANKTYTGAHIRSSYDVRKSFELILVYIKNYNGNVTPLFFELCFNKISYEDLCMSYCKETIPREFPGARKMGLPFNEAVEKYIEWKYSHRLGEGLTKADIYRDDRKLYIAMQAYKRLNGKWPYNIPSQRDLVQQSLEKLYEQGVMSLTGKERTSLSRKFARGQYKLTIPQP